MSNLEMLQSVQFVSIRNKRFAMISEEDWEALIEWLESVEDVQIAHTALAALKAAGGDRQRAGWLDWESAKKDLG